MGNKETGLYKREDVENIMGRLTHERRRGRAIKSEIGLV